MDYLTKPIDRKTLRKLAVIFRAVFEVPQNGAFPVLEVLELVPSKMPGTRYEIVEDSELSITVPAQCKIQPDGNFLIQIKDSVYKGAYERNVGAYRDHILHEICHVFMYRLGYTPILQRKLDFAIHKKYESVEWQAKALCGEIMMPYEATAGMSIKELMSNYGVSKAAAEKRLKY